jgi:hypothetical protein
MFLIDGKPLPVDTPFTHNGIQYPANWLRLTTLEEKEAIGITEEADQVRANDRFYWDGNVNNPKALEDVTETVDGKEYTTKGLKSQFIAQIKGQAGSLLASTDWKVVRAAEGGKPLDDETKDARIAIRTKSDEFEAQITACTTVEELAALNFNWE